MPPSERAGVYVPQPTGYSAFVPRPLPPEPPISKDDELLALLSEADRELARLDAATEFLPNPDLFVRMYVRKEAVLSSQIEGTQASMVDLLSHEASPRRTPPRPVREIRNYVDALNEGLTRLETLPLSSRLVREIHATLLRGVRGALREPGQFRRSQNWIGAEGCTLADAAFVPPPPEQAVAAMADLERFLHDESPMPILIRAGLAHSQFETIHPFLDGNGRMGRLLITFFLCSKGVLRKPTLYLSHYFKQHRQEYYDRLQAVRDEGDFEGWLFFFLRGIRDVAQEGTETTRQIQRLREQHRAMVAGLRNSTAGLSLLDGLFEQPMTTVGLARQRINRSYPVANDLIRDLEQHGLLREITGGARNRIFVYQPYLDIFGELRPS
jgi:Fic family protein